MHRLTAFLYNKEFSNARLIVYLVAYGFFALSLALPVHYACAEGAQCPGCGFREAVGYVLKQDFPAAFALNPLILPTVLITAGVLVDVLAITWHRLRQTCHAPTAAK